MYDLALLLKNNILFLKKIFIEKESTIDKDKFITNLCLLEIHMPM